MDTMELMVGDLDTWIPDAWSGTHTWGVHTHGGEPHTWWGAHIHGGFGFPTTNQVSRHSGPHHGLHDTHGIDESI